MTGNLDQKRNFLIQIKLTFTKMQNSLRLNLQITYGR